MTYRHTYEDVKNYRLCIQQWRDHLEKPDLSDQGAISAHESIERFEKWIGEAGYQVDYRQGEEPIVLPPVALEAQTPETPNYTAYFLLDDGTTDAYDFYAADWIDANQRARQILNQGYREWVEVKPYAVVRGGVTFVHYTHGKKPVGKCHARIIGLNLMEVQS